MYNLSYRSPKTAVKESPIHGKGLFAKQRIPKDEIVAIKGGHILNSEQWSSLEQELESAEIQIAEDFFIAPIHKDHREGSMIYSNHSCDPNIGVQGQIIFVAMREISQGEELTHDWATTDDLDYTLTCKCNSPNCRQTITGQDWRKKELQQKYEGWFSWFIQRKIDAMSS